MKQRNTIIFVAAVIGISLFLIFGFNLLFGQKHSYATDSVKVQVVKSQILAGGQIASQNEANLHFQTGGKLTRVYAKEGDTVYQGQTIANLDTYALQRQLTAALNNYKVTRDTFDQTQQNSSDNVMNSQQRYALETVDKTNLSGQTEVDIINDMIKRLLDQSQAGLDNSVINVELANYALQLSSLTAPFNGLVVHEDVDQAGINITPVTSFMVIDPSALVFRATVNEQDIDYVNVGNQVSISLNGDPKTYSGYVTKIYPEKVTLTNGQSVYKVEITGDFKSAHYAQAGSVQIKSSASQETKLVPRWAVLNASQIWVKRGDEYILKTVKVGKTHGDFIEVLDGLSENDSVITNPQTVVQNKYTVL